MTDKDATALQDNERRKRVLALSSTGGHWVQLLRLAPAFDGCDVHYATTTPDHRAEVERLCATRDQNLAGYHVFADANRWQKLRLVRQLMGVAAIVLRVRPDVIVSTGASAGYFALRVGRLIGARGCWVDSIANAETLSMSGHLAGPHSDLWLTQWPHLAEEPEGPHYRGAVL